MSPNYDAWEERTSKSGARSHETSDSRPRTRRNAEDAVEEVGSDGERPLTLSISQSLARANKYYLWYRHMPRKYRKKKQRKTRRKRMSLVSMGAPSGAPTIRRANLRYSMNGSVQSTTGTLNEYLMSANDLNDPDTSGSGHRPMSWNTWKSLYNHYVCIGSKITVKCISGDATTVPAICGLYLSDGKTLSYTTSTEYIEARKGSYRMISASTNRPFTMIGKYSAKKFFNITDINDNIQRLGADTTTSPSDEAYYHLWYHTLDGSTDLLRFNITIDYLVEFSEPKDLAQSA